MSLFYGYSEVLPTGDGHDNYVKKMDHMKGTAKGNVDMSTFTLTQSTAPTSASHLTNKKYVDDNFVGSVTITNKILQIGDTAYVKKTEHIQGTATGDVNMDTYIVFQSTQPTNIDHLTNKKYVDDNFVSNTGGSRYVKKAEHMQGTATGDVDMSTHHITQPSAPTNVGHLTNKKYVDDNYGSNTTGNARYVKQTEHIKGTAKGNLDMGSYPITQTSAPTANSHLANKKYVDNKREIHPRNWFYGIIGYSLSHQMSNPGATAITYRPTASSTIRFHTLTLRNTRGDHTDRMGHIELHLIASVKHKQKTYLIRQFGISPPVYGLTDGHTNNTAYHYTRRVLLYCSDRLF